MSKNKKESGDTSIYSDSTSTYIESDAYSETDLNALNIDHNNENTDYDPLEGPNEPVVSQVHIDSCTDNKDINQNDNNNISIDGVDSVAAVPSVASAVSVALVCSIGKDNSLDKKINLPKIDNCKSQEINNVKLDDKKQEPKNTCLPPSTNVEYPNISDTFNMSDDLKASFLSQLNELVDGAFDMNDNYEPHSPKSIISYFDSIQKVPNVLSIALLSMFTDIIAKSSQTLKMCCDVNIDITIINNLKFIKDEKITNGYIKILSHVLAYSLTIVKLSCIIKLLSPIEGNLSKNALHLLRTFPIIFSSKQPSHYFHFPKNYKCCSIDMPPITKWNQNSGWTFHCWIKLDNSIKFVENSEKFYIFSLMKRSNNMGYNCYFIGNEIVLTISKIPGKIFQINFPKKFECNQWYMIDLSFQYSRWKTSNITLYVNGECILCSQNSWLISTVQEYDNCCIGNNSIREAAFCGQLGTVYMFNEALSGSYVQAIYSLGRDYKGSFVSESELRSFNNSAPVIYDNLLSRHLVFCYSPSNCENSLCLENTIHYEPSSNFFNNAVTHAYLKCGIKSISRNLPLSCFHSIGGIQIIYPLFELLKLKESMELAAKYNIAEYLMKFIVNFILTSDEALHSFVQTNGFTILSVVLTESNVKYFLTNSVLDCLFEIHEYISRTCASWIIDSFVDSFFLNPNLWIYASSEIQVNLYNYMYRVSIPYALHNSSISRHDHYVRQILYMLRFYYWVTEPEFGSDEVIKCNAQERPSIENLQEIRSILLKCALEFISSSKPHNNDIQTLVNYLLLVKEDDNVHDVLILYVRLMCTHPEIGVPSFSNKNVIEVVVKLLESKDAMIRNNTLKLFGYFLMYSSEERKFVTFQKHNICSLIAEKLMTNLTFLNMKVYNVLYEILIDVITPFVSMEKHPTIMKNARLQNPDIIITIIACIGKSEHCSELLDVVIIFLEDLYRLVVKSGINRRLILQLTVWQNWVYSLSFLRPSCDKENKINELIVDIIIVLLHHALKYENCGWRVWVDTISIIHSIDSYNEFKLMRSEINNRSNSGVGAVAFRNNSTSYDKIESSIYSHDTDLSTHSNENLEDYNDLGKDQKDESLNNLENLNLNDNVRKGDGDGENKVDDTYEIEKEKEKLDKKMGIDNNDKADKAVYFDEHKQNPSFRIPPFKWSKIQHTLFEKLLDVIENDIKPLDESQSFTDLEVTYMVNVVQVLTQLVDIFSYSCGGIIGLLGISSTGNASVELIDLGSETLKTRHAVSLILRFSKILDICALNNAIYLPSLEVEKHLPKGSISRLMLRLAVLSAMRNYFECYFKRENIDISNQQSQIIDKQLVVLFEMANTKMYDNVLDIHQLLQKSDYDRIKIILNKNISDVKTTQGLVLSTLYFLSVLIVSRYRDILEDNAHTPKKENSGDNEKEKFKKKSENVYEIDSTSATSTQIKNENPTTQNTFDLNVEKNDSNSFSNKENPETPISGHIQMLSSTMKSIQLLKCENENVEKLPKTVTIEVESNQDKDEVLHEKILNSLSSAVKLIKYLFQTHKNFLIRTLIGSHGQDIYTPAAHCFEDSTSLVQIVMLICSQEWQTSLLTHAGLSFIELANEGRMLSYAVQDHIIRVATEAEFIINKISAENVEKHAVFNKKFNKSFHLSKNQELTIEYMVSSYRQQNFNMVHNQIEFLRIFFEDRYSNVNNERGSKKFFYLSLHQDNSRRRYKFERNIYGSSHKEANIFFNKNRENAKSGFYPTLDIKNVDTNVFKNSNSDNTSSGEFVNDPNSIISITESVNQQAGKRNCSTSLSNVDTYSIENSLFIQRELSSANVILQNDCHMMSYGLTLKGTMYITNSCLYFDIDVKALKELKEDDFYNRKIIQYLNDSSIKIMFYQIRAIFKRRHLYKYTAIEIFTASRFEYFFLLDSFEMVKRVIAILPIVGVGNQYGLPLSRQTSLLSPPKLFSKSNMTLRWSKREISNFDYLMFLNTIAGRTYNDLNQYFIFPWILTNYDSTELDFSLPSNFRDLSKPIGALNPSRLKYFNDRYKNWDSTKIPSFHYGTHYSTSTFTLNWLVRQEPFTTMYLKIQSGKFDSSRIFQSLAQSWKNCQRDTSDVRELIPEFFYLPEMFLNTCDYNFGSIDSDNKSISDVELPPWASSPEEFVRIHRMALESDMVSCQLHQWIDLIFGYKQSGPEGIKASNIFYHLTYDTTDISKVTDETVREALENQILSYGQTPSNLTKVPHITRASTMHMSPQIFKNQDICCIVKFNSHSDIVKIKFCTLLNKSMKYIFCVTSNRTFSINKWQFDNYRKDGKKSPNPIIIDQVLSSKNFHRRTLEPKYFDQRKYPCENSFIITPDSRFIMASGMNDASFKIFNSDTGKLHQSIYGHYGPVSCMRRFCPLLPNQNFLIATASTDCTIKIWSWNDKEKCIYGNQIEFDKTVNPLPIVTICGHNSVIIDVYIMVEMGIVFSLSTDGILMTHNISGENMQRFSVKSLKFDQNYVKPSNIYVNRDGYMFIAALKPFNNASECECKDDTTSMKSYISVYNYASCRLLRSKPFDLISAAILSKCGNFIVIGSLNGTISILKSHNLENVHSYYPCAAVIRSLELSTDQRFIISGLSDGTLTIYGVNFIRWHQEYEDSFS